MYREFLIFLLGLLLLAPAPAPPAANPDALGLLGDWVTPNKSIVRLYPCDAALCLKIIYVDPAIGHASDGLNPDPSKRNQPLCALVIGSGFAVKGSKAEGGRLYDPESGNTYSGTLAPDGPLLKLHGYIGISLFGRTETWHRAAPGHPSCQ